MSENNYLLYGGVASLSTGVGGLIHSTNNPKALQFSVSDKKWLEKVDRVDLPISIKGEKITIYKPSCWDHVILTSEIRRGDYLKVRYNFNTLGDISGTQTLFEESGGKLINRGEEALSAGRTPKSVKVLERSKLVYFGVLLAGAALIWLSKNKTQQKNSEN